MGAPVKNGEKTDGRNPDGTFAENNPGGPGRPRKGLTVADTLRAIAGDASDRKILQRFIAEAEAGEKWATELYLRYQFGNPIQTNINENRELKPVTGIVVDAPE